MLKLKTGASWIGAPFPTKAWCAHVLHTEMHAPTHFNSKPHLVLPSHQLGELPVLILDVSDVKRVHLAAGGDGKILAEGPCRRGRP